MELAALIFPSLIGASIIAMLFPTYRLTGVWLVLIICLGTGLGLGITSSTIFLWLAMIGPPDGRYFEAELVLAVILVFLAYGRIHYSAANTQKDSGISLATNPETIIWLRNIFLFLILHNFNNPSKS